MAATGGSGWQPCGSWVPHVAQHGNGHARCVTRMHARTHTRTPARPPARTHHVSHSRGGPSAHLLPGMVEGRKCLELSVYVLGCLQAGRVFRVFQAKAELQHHRKESCAHSLKQLKAFRSAPSREPKSQAQPGGRSARASEVPASGAPSQHLCDTVAIVPSLRWMRGKVQGLLHETLDQWRACSWWMCWKAV